jgi:flagellar basal body-associated protein FliL
MSSPSRPKPPRTIADETRRVLLILLVIFLAIAVPAGIVGGINWLDLGTASRGGRPVPRWMTSGEVRATTSDGTLVKVRVAFATGDASTKSAMSSQRREIGLLLQLSVAAQTTQQLAGQDGIEHLADDMLQRVNAYLAASGLRPVRDVAIQDLWYKRS